MRTAPHAGLERAVSELRRSFSLRPPGFPPGGPVEAEWPRLECQGLVRPVSAGDLGFMVEGPAPLCRLKLTRPGSFSQPRGGQTWSLGSFLVHTASRELPLDVWGGGWERSQGSGGSECVL